MWTTILGQLYKTQKKREGKDPYIEWDRFEGKEQTRRVNNIKQQTINDSVRNL